MTGCLPGWRKRWRRMLDHPVAGEATISTVLLWPVVLALIWLLTQAALVYVARNLALSAAEQGAQAGRVLPASPARGALTAAGFLATAGSGLVRNPHISATADAGTVRVQVDATAISLLPGLPLTVHQESVQPIEQLPPRGPTR